MAEKYLDINGKPLIPRRFYEDLFPEDDTLPPYETVFFIDDNGVPRDKNGEEARYLANDKTLKLIDNLEPILKFLEEDLKDIQKSKEFIEKRLEQLAQTKA
jgi:hypothetical protein